MKNKKTNKQRIQIGSSSLLLIFTVLCLVVFSTLSLSSAKADYKLAVRSQQSVQNYYLADNEGENLKLQVNSKIVKTYQEASNSKEFYNNLIDLFPEAYDVEQNKLTYTIDAGEEQFLLVELQLNKFEEINSDKQNFDVLTWAIQNKVDYEIDQSMNVWDGM